MTDWVRFTHDGEPRFGTLDNDVVSVHTGDMFNQSMPTGETLAMDQIELLTPAPPGTMVALWNNFYERAEKEGNSIPEHPLYFMKPASSYLPHGGKILRPKSYSGRVVYEAELGVIIGQTCKQVSIAQAADYVFGYTCVNDVTGQAIIKEDSSFQQWVRAKGFDTFAVCGPYVRTDFEADGARVRALLNGKEYQNYPVADMIFSPLDLVSRISHFMTLQPGDIISCGTSLGARPMKAGDRIEVNIEGLGSLINDFFE